MIRDHESHGMNITRHYFKDYKNPFSLKLFYCEKCDRLVGIQPILYTDGGEKQHTHEYEVKLCNP